MVGPAFWRSEALSVVPWLRPSPTARAGSSTKAQPCVPLISTLHGQPFLIPSVKIKLYLRRENKANKEQGIITLWDVEIYAKTYA